MDLKRGDIVYVTRTDGFGHEQSYSRPAIIVSNDKNNYFSPTVEIVWLTGACKRPLITHVYITTAPKPSTALCEQVTTIDKRRIDRICGFCTEKEMKQINEAIKISLALEGTT